MEPLNAIARRTPPLSDSASLTTLSGTPPDAATGRALMTMMAEAQAYKPNQTLPPGTPDMFLRAWEEIAARFGLTTFRDGLWKALRSSEFFPDPLEIERQCTVLRREAREREAIEAENERVAHYKAHPEMYCAAEEIAEMNEQIRTMLGMERSKAITPPESELLTCPHCAAELPIARNIRFWTPEELRAQADVLEEVQRQAAARRDEPLAALAEQVELVEGIA